MWASGDCLYLLELGTQNVFCPNSRIVNCSYFNKNFGFVENYISSRILILRIWQARFSKLFLVSFCLCIEGCHWLKILSLWFQKFVMNIYITKVCVLSLLMVCRLVSGLCPLLISRKLKRKYGLNRVSKFRVRLVLFQHFFNLIFFRVVELMQITKIEQNMFEFHKKIVWIVSKEKMSYFS